MEEGLAEFAATLVSPVAAAVVLALAFGLRRPWRVRTGSAVLGVFMAAPGLITSAHLLTAIISLVPAAIAACLLQAELCLVLLLPTCRLAAALAAHSVLYLRVLWQRLASGTAKRDR